MVKYDGELRQEHVSRFKTFGGRGGFKMAVKLLQEESFNCF